MNRLEGGFRLPEIIAIFAHMGITLIIILFTAIVGLLCFSNGGLFQTLEFNAYETWHGRQWYRLLSCGLASGVELCP